MSSEQVSHCRSVKVDREELTALQRSEPDRGSGKRKPSAIIAVSSGGSQVAVERARLEGMRVWV